MARPVAAVFAAAVMVLLLTACGAKPGSTVPRHSPDAAGTTSAHSPNAHSPNAQSRNAQQALAFSQCMRANGVGDFPDPDRSGQFPKAVLGRLAATSSHYQAAARACRHLLPSGGTPTQAEAQQVREQALLFSRCIRSHGVPRFPDPGPDGRIPDPASVGIDQGSPQFQAANQACGRYRPPYMPSNAAYNAYARGSGS